jgi:hypothetical protein
MHKGINTSIKALDVVSPSAFLLSYFSTLCLSITLPNFLSPSIPFLRITGPLFLHRAQAFGNALIRTIFIKLL